MKVKLTALDNTGRAYVCIPEVVLKEMNVQIGDSLDIDISFWGQIVLTKARKLG